MEEIKIRQRARDRDILEGDRNTAYFHAMANYRSRKKCIDYLESPIGHVCGGINPYTLTARHG
jgi:hypothetical protein